MVWIFFPIILEAYGLNMKYKIPNIEIYNTFFYTGITILVIKYITGVVLLSNFIIMFSLFIPILYVLSYIIFFTHLECKRYDAIYKEMKEDIENNKEN